MVGLARLELATLRLSGVRSNHLSYRPLAASACVHSLLNRKGYEDGRPKRMVVYARMSQVAPKQSLKGGDPAAGSPTATLLRLHPSR